MWAKLAKHGFEVVIGGKSERAGVTMGVLLWSWTVKVCVCGPRMMRPDQRDEKPSGLLTQTEERRRGRLKSGGGRIETEKERVFCVDSAMICSLTALT